MHCRPDRLIAESAENTPDGNWIRGFSLDWAKFADGRLPTRDDLDAATQVHPVIVYHVSGHHALVNTAAMRDRGISEHASDPAGGRFIRDQSGRMTGLCLDTATGLILPVELEIGCHGPNFHTILPGQDSVALLDAASHEYLKVGLTTVCDPQVTRREMKAYREARRRGVLRLRVVMMPLSNHLDDFINLGLAGPFGDDQLMIGAMKLYADGTLIGGTAWFSEPYGEQGQFGGSTYWTADELGDLVGRAHAACWQVGIHTGGDAAMEMTINAIEAGMRANPRRDTRHRIEHCFYPTPEQIGRMASLGIFPVNQPNMLHDCGDEFLTRLGRRAHRLEPMREEIEAGRRYFPATHLSRRSIPCTRLQMRFHAKPGWTHRSAPINDCPWTRRCGRTPSMRLWQFGWKIGSVRWRSVNTRISRSSLAPSMLSTRPQLAT